MQFAQYLAAIVVAGLIALAADGPARAQDVACVPFTRDLPVAPEPREDAGARARFDAIKAQLKARAYPVLFLGDSLTQQWDANLWRDHMALRGVLNAGVSGDRTEHLRWRLDHGNLAGPPPRVAIVLIGTNDIGHGRPPEVTAEGIRAVLIQLRARLPATRVLLLGLLPRGATVTDHFRRQIGAVNRMIAACADSQSIFYADIGGVLLDSRGQLNKPVSPDTLHFSPRGYALLVPRLDALLDPLISGFR